MIDFKALEEKVAPHMPQTTPAELAQACQRSLDETLDPDWPIGSPLEALKILMMWEAYNDRTFPPLEKLVYALTHSHHHEHADLRSMGVERVYRESLTTKHVSIAWHLAGRYSYDDELVRIMTKEGWPSYRLVDFGAAPWIQTLFFAKKGLRVTAINQNAESDVNKFGRFLAAYKGITTVEDFGSEDPAWRTKEFDVVYSVDVFEHIPPLPDGTPGWIPFAEDLLKTLVSGGIFNVNSPLDYDPGVPKEVAYHNVHFTSPISVDQWCESKGMIRDGYIWRKK